MNMRYPGVPKLLRHTRGLKLRNMRCTRILTFINMRSLEFLLMNMRLGFPKLVIIRDI